MPEPVDLPSAVHTCCGASFMVGCNRGDAIAERLAQVLCAQRTQFPSMSVRVNLWRQTSLRINGSIAGVPVWVRLAEDVEMMLVEKQDRFYQDGVGIIHQATMRGIIPIGFGLGSGDHVEMPHARFARVENQTSQAGAQSLMLSIPLSIFVKADLQDQTLRQIQAGARIVK